MSFKKYGFISDGYRVLNMKHHMKKLEERKPWGNDGKRHMKPIIAFCDELEAKTILDYGCGNGSLKRSIEHNYQKKYKVTEYDPCIIGKCERRPDKADVVVCTDVVEHVEMEFLNKFIYEIYNRCLKGLYLTISTREANELLPDGSNAHRIVRSSTWWINRLTEMKIPIDRADIKEKSVTLWIKKPQPKT